MENAQNWNPTAPPSSAPQAASGGRSAAADGLDSAAASLHEKATGLPGGERTASMAHGAANAASATATYIRDHDAKSMLEDVKRLARNNPGIALLSAAALGFIVAKSLSRD